MTNLNTNLKFSDIFTKNKYSLPMSMYKDPTLKFILAGG